MPAKITIRGGPQTAAALKTLGRRSAQEKVLRSALRPGASNYVKLARANAPRATGLYVKSIAVGIRKTRQAAARLVVGVRPPRSRISHLLEFGTRFMGAIPHMRPAAEAGAFPAIQAFGRTVWPLIAKEATRLAVRRSVRGR